MPDSFTRFDRRKSGYLWPSMQLLPDQTGQVRRYLTEQEFLKPGEHVITTTKAGEGNMNVTILVTTDQRRFILKQSRAWVAKFPDIPAPIERIGVEENYLRTTNEDPLLAAHNPRVLHYDAPNYTLILEYIDDAEDMIFVYTEHRDFTAGSLKVLLEYLSVLHRINTSDFPRNEELKSLNHAHIFDLPFKEDNGFPLDDLFPGLAAVAAPFQRDLPLRQKVAELGRRYLAQGRQLIHGDFYPGSFMQQGERVFIIDGEFAHRGLPEFDLGVLMAHLLLSKADETLLGEIDKVYLKPATFDARLAREFCYVEVIRRLIGIAQLPLSLSLAERKSLLEQARLGLL